MIVEELDALLLEEQDQLGELRHVSIIAEGHPADECRTGWTTCHI